jgi:chloramphenicol 3-O-phosphotransferase
VRGDQFRRFIVNGRADMNAAPLSNDAVEQLQLRYHLAADVARTYAGAGFSVVLQDIYLGDDLAAMVRRLKPYRCHVVVLCPSPEAVHARDADRRATRGKIAYEPGGIDVHALDHALRHETPRLGLWLDTSSMTIEETVAEILSRLSEAVVET